MRVIAAVMCLALVSPAFAQSATVALYAPSATDPNTATPLAAVTYTPTCGVTPKLVEVLPVVNPSTGAYDDPSDASKDCRLALGPQVQGLAPGAGYRAAVRLGAGVFGPFSTAFAVAAQPAGHPCDTTPTSPSSVTVGQGFTLGWCHRSVDTNGNQTTITGWRIYRNNQLVSGVTLAAGATATAAGFRYYSLGRTETAPGSVTFEAAPLNATGEGARTPPLSLSVVQPPAVPEPAIRGRVTVP